MVFLGQADAAYSGLIESGVIGTVLALAIFALSVVVVAVWRSLQVQVNRQQRHLDESAKYCRDTLHKTLEDSTIAIRECSASHKSSQKAHARMADSIVQELTKHDERMQSRFDRLESHEG